MKSFLVFNPEIGQGEITGTKRIKRKIVYEIDHKHYLLRDEFEYIPNEVRLHTILVREIQKHFPDVMFRSDLGRKNDNAFQKEGVDWPDLFIAEQRWHYQGLFVELKLTRDKLYKKDGTLRESKHIQDQKNTLAELTYRGYAAKFCCGFNEAWETLNRYLINISNWDERIIIENL